MTRSSGGYNSGKILKGGKAKKGTFKRLVKYVLGTYPLQFAFVIVFIIISTIANVSGTFFIKIIINDCVVPMIQTGSTDFSKLTNILIIMIILYSLGVLSTYLYNRLMLNISQGTMKKMRDDMFAHMQKLPLRYFDSNRHGELMSRYTNDIEAIRQMVSQSLPQLFVSTLTAIGIMTAMIILSPILALIAVGMTVILLIVMRIITKRSAKFFTNQQKALGKINGYIEEMIEGQKVVKVFNYEKEAIKDFEELNDNLCKSARAANINSGMIVPMTVNLGYLNYVIVAVIGAVLIMNANFTIGALATFLLFTRNFSQPLNQISQQTNFIIMALAGAERIFDVMDEEVEVDNGKVTLINVKKDKKELIEIDGNTNNWAWKVPKGQDFELVPLKGNVVFEDVTFWYNEGKIILNNISLYAKPGQKIAFVGSTGAGKTTITNLINRFYDVQKGKITYDGINILDIKKDSLRKSLGMVLQDTNLFTGTVRENIKYSNFDATDEEVYNAAKLANADDFISKLPDGYDTMLTDNGENLSQGQRQLLSIARAAVLNPPVLILDEATSSIDTRTEKLIQDGMDKLMKGRTVFVIAHRLSTVRNAEAIIVLEHGTIIEKGSHDDLIKLKGQYYQLYTGAFELE